MAYNSKDLDHETISNGHCGIDHLDTPVCLVRGLEYKSKYVRT